MDHIRTGKGISIVLVIGKKNAGKTAYLEQLIERATAKGLKVGGFLSRGGSADQKKSRYFLEDIKTGRQWLLASDVPSAERSLVYDRFHFDPGVFKVGDRLLKNNIDADILVLDEYGPLERMGQGFRSAFDLLLHTYRGILLIAVRPALLNNLKNEIKKSS